MKITNPQRLILQHKQTGEVFRFYKETEFVEWDEDKYEDVTATRPPRAKTTPKTAR